MQQLFEEAMNDFREAANEHNQPVEHNINIDDEDESENGFKLLPFSLGYNTWFVIIILPVWCYMFYD